MEWTVVTVLVGKPIWGVLKELQTLRVQTDYQDKYGC
nr:MAG TPA: hypothetical protein [Caudoviricetes sp.]